MSSLTEIIEKISVSKPGLVKKYNIKMIGVFGSYARNEQKAGSDVDILVDFSEPIGLKFVDLADELEIIVKEKVDLVSVKSVKPKYLEYIKKDLEYV